MKEIKNAAYAPSGSSSGRYSDNDEDEDDDDYGYDDEDDEDDDEGDHGQRQRNHQGEIYLAFKGASGYQGKSQSKERVIGTYWHLERIPQTLSGVWSLHGVPDHIKRKCRDQNSDHTAGGGRR